jgi:hypothetical protein
VGDLEHPRCGGMAGEQAVPTSSGGGSAPSSPQQLDLPALATGFDHGGVTTGRCSGAEEDAERAQLAPWWNGGRAEVSGLGSHGRGVGEEGESAECRGWARGGRRASELREDSSVVVEADVRR